MGAARSRMVAARTLAQTALGRSASVGSGTADRSRTGWSSDPSLDTGQGRPLWNTPPTPRSPGAWPGGGGSAQPPRAPSFASGCARRLRRPVRAHVRMATAEQMATARARPSAPPSSSTTSGWASMRTWSKPGERHGSSAAFRLQMELDYCYIVDSYRSNSTIAQARGSQFLQIRS